MKISREWFELAIESGVANSVLRAGAAELAGILPKLKAIKPKPKVPFKHRNNYWGTESDENKDTTAKDRGNALGQWLIAVQALPQTKALLADLVDSAIRSKTRFPADAALYFSLLALRDEDLINLHSPKGDYSTNLWIHISEFLLKRSEKPPAQLVSKQIAAVVERMEHASL